MNRFFTFFSLLFIALMTDAQVILYKNNFETPISMPNPNGCGAGDYDAQSIDKLYNATGTHPKSLGILKGNCVNGTIPNCNSAEVLIIKGFNMIYADPSGKGGKFCIGLQNPSNTINDLFSFQFNPDLNTTVDLAFDVSASTITTCNNGSPLFIDSPKVRVRFFRTTGFDIDNINNNLLISTAVLDGLPKAPTNSDATNTVMNWKSLTAAMNTIPKDSTKPASGITAVFELIGGVYAAFDNIAITGNVVNSIQSWESSTKLSLSPNPVQKDLKIDWEETNVVPSSIEIIDMHGIAIARYDASQINGTYNLLLESLAPGAYSVLLKDALDGIVSSKRFIKE